MKVKQYPNGDFEQLDQTDLYCPNCGESDVYKEQGEGDFYEGPDHFCHSCKTIFKLSQCGINEQLEFKSDEP